MNPPSTHRRDSEAADALASSAQNGPQRSGTNNRESLPSFSPTVVHKSLPLASANDNDVKLEPSIQSNSSVLPPLAMFLGPDKDEKPVGDANAPASIPLFMPAQVDRKLHQAEAKASKTGKSAVSKKSSSPAPLLAIEEDVERAAVEAATNEHGLRGARKPSDATTIVSTTSTIPKKRAAPKAVASHKKGTAKKSSSAVKRRKIELDTPTPSDTRSNTPASRTSRLDIKSRISVTPGPDDSSIGADESEVDEEDEEDGDSNEDEELFCICRKPDDHKYMIACDAGCDDWFHGKCVKISEDDGKLIDRYICPNCEAKGKGETTWKPMCRRSSCRKPARLTGTDISKYCSQDCGLRFFSELISRYPEDTKAKTRKSKPTKSTTQDLPDSRAGPLDPFQLKALVDSAADSKIFRSLGNGILQPLSPGLSKTFSSLTFPIDDQPSQSATFIPTEQAEIDRITAQKNNLRDARSVLEDRKRYFGFAKDRLAAYIEKANIKPKDICGFDQRLAWSTERFQRWRNSAAGIAVFERGALEPHSTVLTNGLHPNGSSDDVKMTNGIMTADAQSAAITHDNDNANNANNDDDNTAVVLLCARKRCERHKMWQRLQVEEARSDESRLADEMRLLDKAEREVRERGAMRARRQVSGLLERQGVAVPASGSASGSAASTMTTTTAGAGASASANGASIMA